MWSGEGAGIAVGDLMSCTCGLIGDALWIIRGDGGVWEWKGEK